MKKKFTKSKKFYNRAKKVIPLATQTFSKSALQWPLGASPMFFNNAKGCRIYDVDKNGYIDYLLAVLPIVCGYRDLDVDKAVKKQMKQGVIFSMSHAIEIQLAEELVNIIPYAEMVRFGKNGSDVLTAAVRLARAYTKKDIILFGGLDYKLINKSKKNRSVGAFAIGNQMFFKEHAYQKIKLKIENKFFSRELYEKKN